MKNNLLTLAGTLALVAVLGKFYAIPAVAQVTRAALVQDRDSPARSAFTAKVSVDGDLNAAFPAVPAGKRMSVLDAQCEATVTADNSHESHYTMLAIANFFHPTYAGSAPFDMALDSGQQGQANLFCTATVKGETVVVAPFPTAAGPATASQMDVVYSGYFIDVP